MKSFFVFFLFLLYAQNCFTQTNATSLVGTKWLFEETIHMAISFELTFKADGTALWKGTNTPMSDNFSWFGNMDNIKIEGNFGSGSTITLQGSLSSGILNYSIPWSVNGKSGIQGGQYKTTKIQSAQQKQTTLKTIDVRLNGIFMGECGNPNDCTHEPVAGEVHIYLMEKNTGNKIASTNFGYTLWNSNKKYNLVCNNYKPATGYGNGSGDGFSTPESQANNIQSALSFIIDEKLLRSNQYEWVVRFNLGNAHKDNDFASTGYHWLKEGNAKMESKMNLPTSGNTYTTTIGSYETASNRCHQYWLQFNMKVY